MLQHRGDRSNGQGRPQRLNLGDFGPLLGTEVYGTLVTTPRDLLVREGLG